MQSNSLNINNEHEFYFFEGSGGSGQCSRQLQHALSKFLIIVSWAEDELQTWFCSRHRCSPKFSIWSNEVSLLNLCLSIYIELVAKSLTWHGTSHNCIISIYNLPKRTSTHYSAKGTISKNCKCFANFLNRKCPTLYIPPLFERTRTSHICV